jgi:hypothetical protein
MKKIILIGFIILPFGCFAQRDSSKMIFAHGIPLDTSLVYISASMQIFSTPKTTEVYWVGGWRSSTDTPVKTDYGMNMKKIWDDMIKLSKDYSLTNYKGKILDIKTEDDLFNAMAANGYRFLSKTAIPPMNVGIAAARAYGGSSYKFEKK